MNTHDKIELPPLPDLPCYRADLFDPEVRVVEASLVETLLQQYARAAIEADCKWLEAAARTVAELAAIIPVSDILGATATCQDMIDYFKRLIADRKRRGEPDAVAACHAVRPYIDSIVCYASTMDEHDGNRVAKMVEDVCAAHPQPAEPVDKSKNLQGSVVDKAEEMQGQPAEPVKLECPKCGAERSKVPCAGELMNCHFRGEAQSAEPSKQSEVREYLQQTLRTAADEACRLIANSDTPTKFEGIFGHRAELVAEVSQKISGEPGINGSVLYAGVNWIKAPPPFGTKLYTAPVVAQPSAEPPSSD